MSKKWVRFSITDNDLQRLDRLVAQFGGGDRSAFLREAMHQLEVADRAERLQHIQCEVSTRAAEKGIGPAGIGGVIKRVLAAQSAER